jgi:predicted kinase
MDAIRIRSDLERKRLFGRQPLERMQSVPSDDIYTAEASERTYARLAELAGAILDGGYSVIVDAAFLERDRRRQFWQLAAAHNVPFRILDVQTSADALRRRVAERAREGRDASDADLSVLEGQLRSAEPIDAGEQVGLLQIEGTAPPPAGDIVARLTDSY